MSSIFLLWRGNLFIARLWWSTTPGKTQYLACQTPLVQYIFHRYTKANLSSISIKDISNGEDLFRIMILAFCWLLSLLCPNILPRKMSFQIGHFSIHSTPTKLLALFFPCDSGTGTKRHFVDTKRKQRFVNSWLIPMKNWCWFVRCSLPKTFPYGTLSIAPTAMCWKWCPSVSPEMGIFGNVSNRSSNNNNIQAKATLQFIARKPCWQFINWIALLAGSAGGDVLGNKWNKRNFVVIRKQGRHFISPSEPKQRKPSQFRVGTDIRLIGLDLLDVWAQTFSWKVNIFELCGGRISIAYQ